MYNLTLAKFYAVGQYTAMDFDKVLSGVKMMIEGLGDSNEREGLRDTPRRVAETLKAFFKTPEYSDEELLHQKFHVDHYNDMVIVKGITFSSFCEHHLLPFFGKVAIAYIPSNDTVVGISKLARIVDKYSKCLQIQERMTQQIHNAIAANVAQNGVLVIVSAQHMCMTARGILQPSSSTVTRALSGVFEADKSWVSEAQQLIFS